VFLVTAYLAKNGAHLFDPLQNFFGINDKELSNCDDSLKYCVVRLTKTATFLAYKR